MGQRRHVARLAGGAHCSPTLAAHTERAGCKKRRRGGGRLTGESSQRGGKGKEKRARELIFDRNVYLHAISCREGEKRKSTVS